MTPEDRPPRGGTRIKFGDTEFRLKMAKISVYFNLPKKCRFWRPISNLEALAVRFSEVEELEKRPLTFYISEGWADIWADRSPKG